MGLLRSGAQRLIEQAVAADLAVLLALSQSVSTGDFHEAPTARLGPNAAGLSATTISRLKADWWGGYDRWPRRDPSTRRFVYIWADGV